MCFNLDTIRGELGSLLYDMCTYVRSLYFGGRSKGGDSLAVDVYFWLFRCVLYSWIGMNA